MSAPPLAVEGLRVELDGGDEIVDEITFAIEAGEILGLVGESGSGKSTIALAPLGHARRGAANGRRPAGAARVATQAPEPLVTISGVDARHRARQVLFDVGRRIEARHCVALVGGSGSGKSRGAGAPELRRDHLGTRRFGAGGQRRTPRRAAARDGRDAAVRDPQSRARAGACRPGRGDARRPDRRALRYRPAARRAARAVHAGARPGHAERRARAREVAKMWRPLCR